MPLAIRLAQVGERAEACRVATGPGRRLAAQLGRRGRECRCEGGVASGSSLPATGGSLRGPCLPDRKQRVLERHFLSVQHRRDPGSRGTGGSTLYRGRPAGKLAGQRCGREGDVVRPLLGQGGGDVGLERLEPGDTGLLDRVVVDDRLRLPRTGEDAEESVVIPCGDGVELVVVAAGAGNGQPLKRLAERVDLVLDHLRLFEGDVGGRGRDLHHPLAAGAENGLVDSEHGIVPGRQEITGQMLGKKAIVGHVGVHRPDDVIAIPPGVGDRIVADIAAGLAEPHQVEPVFGPVLAERRALEQFVYELGRGIGTRVVHKLRHLLGRGRQADERDLQPADERGAVGRRRGLESAGDYFFEQEAIDRLGEPRPMRRVGRERHLRHGNRGDRLPRPVRTPRGELRRPRLTAGRLRCRRRIGQAGQAVLDPLLEIGDHRVGQLVGALRHLPVFDLMADQPQEQAGGGLLLVDEPAAFATRVEPHAGVEPQAPFRRIAGMAFVTVLDEHRPDP